LCCAAGVFCKESIATAPVMVALFDRVFLFDSWREQWGERRRLYIGLAATWIPLGLLIAAGPRALVVGFSSGVSPWTYLLNQAEVIAHYLRLAVWPDALVAFYGWPSTITLAEALPYVAFIGALLALTGVALWRWPALGFLGAWFFVTLAPASSIVPVATEVGAERRMYLPLIAVSVLAVLAVDAAARIATARGDSRSRGRYLAPLVMTLVAAALLASATVDRNRDYRSPLTLARTIVERRPTAVAHHMLAEQLALVGRYDEAMPHLRQAIALGNSRARYLLAQILVRQNRDADAIEQLEAFVATYQPARPLVPKWLEAPLIDVIPARFLLGRTLGARGDWDGAEAQARAILELVPSHIGAHGMIGDAMFARQQWGAAVEHYGRYLARQPSDSRALINYGIAFIGLEQLDEAIAAFRRASELDPANSTARQMLAMAEQDRQSQQRGSSK
jgi:protein O-mannosyl-transferase